MRSGAERSFSRWSPRSRSPSVPIREAVDAETSTWPPWPQAAMRRGSVHVGAHVPLIGEVRSPGVDAHAHPDWPSGQRGRRSGCRLERARRRRERDEEGVPLRVHLDAAGERQGLPQDAPMLCQRLRVPLRPRARRSSFVDPSISVNRNVTVPVGRSSRTRRIIRLPRSGVQSCALETGSPALSDRPLA